MITFIAFLLTIIGCINWLLIGMLQYDFIAGFFGFQASIFSRIFYILFGIAALYLLLRVIINKGTFKVFERKKKKEKQAAPAPQQPAYAAANAPSQEFPAQEKQEVPSDTLFDEHMKK